jgi:hypothetical protein
MSLSEKERVENLEYALRLIVRDIGDNSILTSFIPHDGSEYANILNTTWKELKSRTIIRSLNIRPPRYVMTGYGWIVALKASGEFDSEGFKEKVGKLSAALKRQVKGRHDKAFPTIHHIAQASELPVGFIISAIESNLTGKLFNEVGAKWLNNSAGLIVEVPLNFGL